MIAYLTSQYPAVSHTFIRREITALRARGVAIRTFSLRRPGVAGLSVEDLRECAATYFVLPRGALEVIQAQIAALAGRPGRYLATLRLALRHRTPGARPALWSLFHFAEAMVLARELERAGVVHLHTHFSNAGGCVGFLASRFLGIGWSLTLHGSADFDSPTRPLLREKIAAARFTVCVSRDGKARAEAESSASDHARNIVVRCGIELSRFPYRGSLPAQPGRRLRVLSVGRLSPEKGQLLLVEAFAQVVQAGIDAELRILGEGPERVRLEEAIRRLGVGDRCTLPGARPENEVAVELAAADVFALSSYKEGLPVVLMEAMAVGVVTVAPRLSGIPELIDDGVNGAVFAPGDGAGLHDKLSLLLRDPERRAVLAGAARMTVERDCDINRTVEELWRRFSAAASTERAR